ncbi:acetyl-CoA carboxylase biotin carboxyl carrier protein subunit [Chloroflexus islandicus]|uniref:Acetyl-CoA carboxylase biotin carboxyl carrier protein subunit n=1 Tax=Chloroflexus islandicus TaxID=1707952 RepID=A0A178MDJ6_9CHLR|nr:biotin/lipoyl-containing protein [Chloroflexus islandicus]OAN46890.1 acetyl-CoA carboxylase biotin carboxyl carrier protein subunit [Chloroflexus islandicus]
MRRYQLTINGKTYTVDIAELSSDRFAVQLDGREFEVQLSESGDIGEITPRATPVPVALPATPAAPAAPPPAALPPAAATGDNLIRAPMPGTILQIVAQPGAKVKRGQPIIVLEAMKMNNSIGAPRDGVVAAILVKTGQSVGYGEPLAQLAEG